MERKEKYLTNIASCRFLKTLPFILISLYFSLAVIKIRYPGVQYDELLWGNAALGGIDWTFIVYKIGNLPVLLMPYIGAVKAYIYYPIFKVFGVSPWSIRIPAIILTALALYPLFMAARKYFDDRTALLALFLFSIDPSFISQTRVDCGPIVLEFCCKVLAIYLLLKLLDKSKLIYLFGIYLVLAVGLFNKLNFMWFINSFVFSTLIVYYKNFRNNLADRPVNEKYLFVVSTIMGYATLVGYYLFISRVYGLSESINLFLSLDRLAEIFGYLKVLITGESFYVYALGDIDSPLTYFYFFFVSLLLIAGFVLVSIKGKYLEQGYRKGYYFFGLIFLTTLYQICITKQAGANWHLFSVYPFITILLAVSVLVITKCLPFKDRIRNITMYSLIAVAVSYCTVINVKYINAYGTPTKNIHWSDAIYELIDYTKNTPYKYVSVDWGTQAQLITFDPYKEKYFEICYGLNVSDADTSHRVINIMLEPYNNFAFIMHTLENTCMMNPRSMIFLEAEQSGKRLKLIKTVSDDGKRIFEIYVPERKS